MALTTTEEAQVRDLIAQETEILNLAANEPTIISKLGATKVTLSDLEMAASLNGADLFLVRQGTDDKAATIGQISGGSATVHAIDVVSEPFGDIAAINVQYALQELDTKKASLVSPAFTGNPTAPTPTPGDSDTSIATTAFVAQAVSAAGGLLPSNNVPVMDGAASAGVGTAASRDDHRHPTDTTRAALDSPNFTGNPTAPTPAPGDNDVSIATTAFVAQAVSASGGLLPSNNFPLVDGTASAGVGSAASRDDHRHPTDTSRAPIVSPAFSGTPTAPTPSNGDNSTKLATTAFVLANAGAVPSSSTPAMDGIGSAGTATPYSRGDHRHPSDTSRAPIDSPAFSGTPTAPTPAQGDNTTKLATTAFVLANGGAPLSNATPVMDGTASAGVATSASRGDHKHPVDTSRAAAAAETAIGTTFTPTGTIAATNVQSAIAELGTEKVNKAGDTMTGSLILSSGTININNGSLYIGPIADNSSHSTAYGSVNRTNLAWTNANEIVGQYTEYVIDVKPQQVGATKFSFRDTGIGYAPGGWQTGSDERLKSNIEVIPGALAKVQALRGCTFHRDDLNKDMAGVIAQDLQAVLPVGVGDLTAELLSVDPMAVIALLVEAVKELSARLPASKGKK